MRPATLSVLFPMASLGPRTVPGIEEALSKMPERFGMSVMGRCDILSPGHPASFVRVYKKSKLKVHRRNLLYFMVPWLFLSVAANLEALRYHVKYSGLWLLSGVFNETHTHPARNNQVHRTPPRPWIYFSCGKIYIKSTILTIFKCLGQCHYVYSDCQAMVTTVRFQASFNTSYGIYTHELHAFPSTQPLVIVVPLSFSMIPTTVSISHKRDHQ